MLDTSFSHTVDTNEAATFPPLPQSSPDPAVSLFSAAQAIAARLYEGTAIDRAFLRSTLEEAFGGSDGTGLWNWKDAYEAQEAALVLTMQRYGVAILKQPPERALAMVEKLQSLTMSQTRRDDEMMALQQFSTPLPLGYAVWLAARLSPSDSVFEPSAGTGLLAAFAHASGCSLTLNEISRRRSGLLQRLFPDAPLFHHNGEQIVDYMAGQPRPDVILMNPPFSTSPNMKKTNRHVTAWHISSALQHLADGGRLVAITGAGFAAIEPRWREPFQRLQQNCRVVFSVAIDGRLYAKHGTNTNIRLTVFDKVPADDPTDTHAYHGSVDKFPDLMALIHKHVLARPALAATDQKSNDAGQEQEQRSNVTPSQSEPRPQVSSAKASSPAPAKLVKPKAGLFTPPAVDWTDVQELDYAATDWQTPDGAMQAELYELYQPQSVVITDAKDHPTKLVQSAAMASIAPPKPGYQPHLPLSLVTDGVLSAAQLESIIYAGEAHEALLSGFYTVDESYDTLTAASDDDADAHQYRKGWFLGDGTGCGKGRQVAGIILDNWLKGRKRAVWVSKSDKLLEDARRDWSALGGSEDQVIPLAKFKQGEDIRLSDGILFVTYGTLRTGAKQGKISRVEQIVNWLTTDFDGVIVFDEAHAMANATASKGNRGIKKPSQQGLSGLRLQHALPDARIVYVSATGATEVGNLAYAERLGLWGSDEFPFTDRSDFITQMEQGGVAAMEMISRDLKSLGLYTARSLSYDGVAYEPLGL